MDHFVLIPYSIYQSQSTLPKKTKLEQKQEKEEIVPKDFVSIYSAVNAKLKTSNNEHLIDLNLISPRIRLSQSEIIILDKRDTKKINCRLFIYFFILEATRIPPKLVVNKDAKAKDRGTWIPFKI